MNPTRSYDVCHAVDTGLGDTAAWGTVYSVPSMICLDPQAGVGQVGPVDGAATGSGFCHGQWGIEWLGMVVVLLSNIIVIGLSKVCEWLADPYGDDITDLNVQQFVTFTLQKGLEILKVGDMPTMTMSRAKMWKHEQSLRNKSHFVRDPPSLPVIQAVPA